MPTGSVPAFKPRMVWRGFAHWRDEALSHLLGSLVGWNRFLLSQAPLPSLYGSGVRYIREDYTSEHPEDWLDILETIHQGGGDCEDLACWRTAELQHAGERARVVWHRRLIGPGQTLLHILVQRADGRLEDPSRILGMGQEH